MAEVLTLSDREFRSVRELLYASTGINLGSTKRQMVVTRLRKRLLELELESVAEYLEHLGASGSDEHQRFVNLLTTNKTSFFREAEHFDHLESHLRKLVVEQRRSRLRLWSAASSTGEEAFSMAMTAFGVMPPGASYNLRILATDIDTAVLDTARRAIYPESALEDIPDAHHGWLSKGTNAHSGFVRPKRALRDVVAFRQLNLREPPWPPKGPFDAIFCRNVLIYFDAEAQVETTRALASLLSRDGFLYLGHAEGLVGVRAGLVPSGHATFRLPGGARP